MNAMMKGARAQPQRAIEEAASKTAQIQQDLTIAEAELELTNTVLSRPVPVHTEAEHDVRKAVAQNVFIEEKVGGAVENLEEVKELLQAEVLERQRLERELEQSRSSS